MKANDLGEAMWAEACALIERAERLHRRFFLVSASPAVPKWQPPVDVFESGRDLLVVVILPGVREQDIDFRFDGPEVLIAGVRRMPPLAQGASIRRLEGPYGRFERRIPVDDGYQLERSELADGCLSLRLVRQSDDRREA